MQAMLAVIQSEDAPAAIERLAAFDLAALSPIAGSGGFLRQGNTVLCLTARDDQVQPVLDALRETCHRRTSYMPAYLETAQLASAFPVEVEIGGATVFICEIERFESY